MLATIEPAEFDEWMAFRRIEPDPEERLAEILKRGLVALANSWGCQIEPNILDPKHDKPTPEQARDSVAGDTIQMTPRQAADQLRAWTLSLQ